MHGNALRKHTAVCAQKGSRSCRDLSHSDCTRLVTSPVPCMLTLTPENLPPLPGSEARGGGGDCSLRCSEAAGTFARSDEEPRFPL